MYIVLISSKWLKVQASNSLNCRRFAANSKEPRAKCKGRGRTILRYSRTEKAKLLCLVAMVLDVEDVVKRLNELITMDNESEITVQEWPKNLDSLLEKWHEEIIRLL